MWHEHHVQGGDYPYSGGWVSQPLDLLVKFQAMTLMYSYKMAKRRIDSGNANAKDRATMEEEITDLQRDMANWVEGE